MSVCKNPLKYTDLVQGKKYNVYEETEDTLVLSGWYAGETQGRSAQLYMVFRLDKADPVVEYEDDRGWMYGVFNKADEDGEYQHIKVRAVVPPRLDEGATYRYCLVEGGKRRKTRKARRRKQSLKGKRSKYIK